MPNVDGHPVRSFKLELDSHRLAGWSWGEGPLALLVHGWEGSAAHMAPAAARLAGAGFRVVALDMPAHGQSSGRRTSLVHWLRVLRDLPATLGAPDVVVGHSFGATALTHALAEGFPAERAVLIAPPLGPQQFIERAQRFIGLPPHRIPGMVRRLSELVGRDIEEFDASRAAASIAIPGLIVHDPADPDVPWAHAECIARSWRSSRLHARAGVGHFRILGDAATLELVTEFAGGGGARADLVPAGVALGFRDRRQ
jgi:pimeloyl-ACP methyl ester carboxylesterase